MKDIRYDRQLRLWGEEGQHSIETSAVCVLGSSALACEIVKSLVLAGVQSVCLIDDVIVSEGDLGNNFFLTEDDLGKRRAEATIKHLKELNPSVSGESVCLSVCALSPEDLSRLVNFSVVVASNLPDDVAATISEYLFPRGVPFLSARVFGLLGFVRVSVKEHTIANNHDENLAPDLRLDKPFDSLTAFVNEMKNFSEMSSEELKHTPYILLFFKGLQQYRRMLNDSSAFPRTSAERKHFLGCVWSLRGTFENGSTDSENFDEAKAALTRTVRETQVPSAVRDVISDENCSADSRSVQPFWLVCSGLRRFVEKHGVLPLSGTLPDMTSDSQRYARLSSIFHEKALEDAAEVLQFTKEVERERGVADTITQEQCYRFCKNAAKIRFQRGTPMCQSGDYKEIVERVSEADLDSPPTAALWLLLLRAADKFALQKGRFPGTNGVPCAIDSFDLKQRVDYMIRENGFDVCEVSKRVPKGALDEICRYGAAEPHVIASLIGGIVAQEVIKLATNQYVPLDNTLLFDGHTQMTETFRL